MNYRIRRQGEDLGIFSLDELRRRRQSGELTGGEYVQGEGMSDWQPLDLVLQQGYRLVPPPLPAMTNKSGPGPGVVWLIIVSGIIFFICVVAFASYMAINVQRGYQAAVRSRPYRASDRPVPDAEAAASRPIVWTTNTITARDIQKRNREFRIREWLDDYEQRGQRNPACDAESAEFIRAWIDHYYGGPNSINPVSLDTESDRLANNPNCTDPLVLTVAADNSLNYFDEVHRFELALKAYPGSRHRAYCQLYATVLLMDKLGNNSEQTGALDTSALKLLPECFSDGSFTPADQQEIADIFVYGWAQTFFSQNDAAVCEAVHRAGPSYQWLALVLDGERYITEAWRTRGGGYSDSVTAAGWRGFHENLSRAREALTQAWKMRPDYPLAPARMMEVALGESGIGEMRLWFDRTLSGRVDHDGAWSSMRWGLRPRWYGSHVALLDLGRTAINTGRFDTDVPYQFFHCVADVESEMDLAPGRHIYDRSDIWPEFQKMYEGYINAPAQSRWGDLNRWRSAYAVVSYFAGKYSVAREQLAALDWKPAPQNLRDWGVDLSLMPLEVAARTGSLGKEITAAESAYSSGDVASALKIYSALGFLPGADDRTREFIQLRLGELKVEDRLHQGQWVDLMPGSDHDPNWVISFGKVHRLPGDALEVEYGPKGHMLFSRVPVGAHFEVRGQFEVVRSSNKNFQAGIVMGLPDFNSFNWYGFRIKRHDIEGDVVCIGEGWSRRQIVQHVVLNDVTNSFDFILQNKRMTASINGVEVFHQAEPPSTVQVPDNSYLVGLGAFSDTTDAVIRYRDVQLKQIQ